MSIICTNVLSTPEKLLLSKGLSFIPTARDLNNFEIVADFNKFSQKLHNKVCQSQHHPNQDGFDLYRKDKEPNKQISRPTKLLQFKSTLEQMKVALSTLPCNVRVESNLSRRQTTALHNVCRNRNIIIKKPTRLHHSHTKQIWLHPRSNVTP